MTAYFPAHCSFGLTGLSKTCLNAIQLIESLPDKIVSGYSVSCLKNSVAFMFFRCSEKTKHRELRGLNRKNRIIAAIEHQSWNHHSGSKVDLIHLRPTLLEEEASVKNTYLETILRRKLHPS